MPFCQLIQIDGILSPFGRMNTDPDRVHFFQLLVMRGCKFRTILSRNLPSTIVNSPLNERISRIKEDASKRIFPSANVSVRDKVFSNNIIKYITFLCKCFFVCFVRGTGRNGYSSFHAIRKGAYGAFSLPCG